MPNLFGQEVSEDVYNANKHLATPPKHRQTAAKSQPVAGPVEAKDAGLAIWLAGVKNAQKAADRKAAILKRQAVPSNP